MAQSMNTDIVVVGAGITGLTAAYYLKRYGKSVLVLEKGSTFGGVINTVKEDGFIYESGPNSGTLSTIEAVDLFADLGDSCSLETANEQSKKRLIWKNGRWEPLPSGIISAVGTPLFSLKDKFRILGEPFRKPGDDPHESIASLVRRRLGASFLDYAVNPFISGIYAGDPELIVTKYALPKLYDLEQEYGSFIGGTIKKMRNRDKTERKPSREVFSAYEGLSNLINAIAEGAGKDNIMLNCSGIKISPEDNKYKITFLQGTGTYDVTADKVITTVGAYALPELLPFIKKDEMEDISSLRYARVVQVILGFRNWNGIKIDAFGGLVPGIEKRKILGVLFLSALFKNRAPKNGALLSVFMGGIKNPAAFSVRDEEITESVKNEIMEMMGLNEFIPDLLRIFRYPHAIPQYEASSGRRLEQIASFESQYPGLILAGNIRDGIGMADRIKQARRIADNIIKNE